MSRFPFAISWNQLASEITRQHETPSRVYLSAIENLITSKCVPILYLLSCLFKLSWNSILEAHYNIKVSWVSDLWGKKQTYLHLPEYLCQRLARFCHKKQIYRESCWWAICQKPGQAEPAAANRCGSVVWMKGQWFWKWECLLAHWWFHYIKIAEAASEWKKHCTNEQSDPCIV